jgi:hypothetical protein
MFRSGVNEAIAAGMYQRPYRRTAKYRRGDVIPAVGATVELIVFWLRLRAKRSGSGSLPDPLIFSSPCEVSLLASVSGETTCPARWEYRPSTPNLSACPASHGLGGSARSCSAVEARRLPPRSSLALD